MANGMEIASFYATLGADFSDLTKGFKQAKEDMSTFEKGMSGVHSAVGVGLKAAVGVGIAAVTGLTAAIGFSVTKAADMEQGIADIGAMMNLSAESTAQLQEHIMDLGLDPNLKVSATEAAGAVMALGTAGLSMTEIMNGASEATVLLANATGLKGEAGFAAAASIATDVMAQFSIQAGDLEAAVSAIAGTTVASKFSIDDYRLAIAQAGGVAGAVGVDFDDFNAVIAATSSSFASGSDAGTSFKTFLQRLVPSTNPAKEAMNELGLSTDVVGGAFLDAQGNLRPMEEIAGVLSKAFSGLSDSQKIEAASTIFGTDAMRTALALAEGGAPIIAKMKTEIGNVDAEELAAKRMDTLSGSWEIFQGVVETLTLGLGNAFIPVVRLTVDWLTTVAQQVGPLVIDFFKGFTDRIAAIVPLLKDTNFLYEDGSGILLELSKSFGINEEAAKHFWAAVWEAKETIGNFITSILDNVTAFVDWNKIITTAMTMLPVLWERLVTVTTAIGDVIAMVRAVFAPLTEAIGQFFGWKDIASAVAAMLTGTLVAAIGAWIASMAPVLTTVAAVSAAIAALRWAWENDFMQIRTVTQNTLGKISDWFFKESGIWKGTLEDTLTYLEWWGNYGWREYMYNPVVRWVLDTTRDLVGYWNDGVRKFKEITHILWQEGMHILLSFKDDVIAWVQEWTSYITKKLSDWTTVTKSEFHIFVGWIIRYFTDWRDAAVEKYNQMVADVKEWVTKTFAWFKPMEWLQAGIDLVQGLWDGMKRMWANVVNWWRGEAPAIGREFEDTYQMHSPSRVFMRYGTDMMAGLQYGLSDGVSGVTAAFTTLGTSINNSMTAITSTVGTQLNSTIQSVIEGVRYGADMVNLATADVLRMSMEAEAKARAQWEKLRAEMQKPLPPPPPPVINPQEDTNAPPPIVPTIILPPIVVPPPPVPLTFSEFGFFDALKDVFGPQDFMEPAADLSAFADTITSLIDNAVLTGKISAGDITGAPEAALSVLYNAENRQIGDVLDSIQTLINVILTKGLASGLSFDISQAPEDQASNRVELIQLIQYLVALNT